MVAPLSLFTELEEAAAELMAAQAHYAEAANDAATAKANLEYKRADLICQGIEGKNAEQREAMLRLALFQDYADLLTVEQEAIRTKCRLERAQTALTVIRYKIRLLEVMKGAES